MDKVERLHATIAGEEVDRVAVSAWQHQPVDDQSAETFAAATLMFQRDFDFDFVKVTPASSYCLRDWGVNDSWCGHPHGTREYGDPLIQRAADWGELRLQEPRDGQMGAVLRALDLIHLELGSATPFVQTIFSPLGQAVNMAGAEGFLSQLRQHPDMVRVGLEIITEQTLRFIECARETGISGVFYALQWASYSNLAESEYREFARPYDLRILEASSDLWLNVLHVHGHDVMFAHVSDYPAAIINWHDMETWPSLSEALGEWPAAVCGGVRQEETLVQGTANQVISEGIDAIRSTGGRRLILGTGCVTPMVAPYGNLRALRDVVESVNIEI